MKNIPGRHLLRPAFFLSCAVFLSSCVTNRHTDPKSTEQQTFQAEFWQTPMTGSEYPEMADPEISSRPSFGIAFQGGGNRASPAALGQLRALHELGWIDQVRYIAAVSGGSWTAIPYTFLKRCPTASGISCNQDLFLGKSRSPEHIARHLPGLVRGAVSEDFAEGSMLEAISKGKISGKVINAWMHGRFDESFAEALGEIYLAPFGLARSMVESPESVFTWRETDRDRIARASTRLSAADIHYVERKRPYLIVGGTVLTKRTLIDPEDKFRMEMTPLYTGVPQRTPLPSRTGGELQLGGGFVESFGYDYVTDAIKTSGTSVMLTLRDPVIGNRTDKSRLNFSLANMAAVSGAAPVESTVSIRGLQLLAANFGFPEHYVPVDQETDGRRRFSGKKGEVYEKEWAHGDGGHEDNLGLAPLLVRRVENILVLANSHAPFSDEMIRKCETAVGKFPLGLDLPKKMTPDMSLCIKMIGDDIPSFFVKTKTQIHNVGLSLKRSAVPKGREALRGYYDLLTVAKDIRDQDNLSCQRYQYTPSYDDPKPASGHRPYTPKICILFLGLDEEWVEEIKTATERHGLSERDIRSTLNLGADWKSTVTKRRMFGTNGFPHIATFLDNPGYLIHTDRSRLFALSNFTSWKLKKHHEFIGEYFGISELRKTR